MENPNAAGQSPFFLVEVIGDSEAASDPAWNADGCEAEEADHDDDDAESSSCDSSDHRDLNPGFDSEGCRDDEAEAAAGMSGDELQIDRFPTYRAGLFSQDLQVPMAEQKSCVSVDSASPTNELMNEMERSRLFWEACLASS
ncbi:uncharacterized protein LOC116190375 [Punica granatum]|nr:uncharacterized protein LOC116190375 [Punica granatum]PKI70533.1 hypothetical protein CRG98_009038 [Punica granatum]